MSSSLLACDGSNGGERRVELTAPTLPELSLTAPTRGAFLGVWGADRETLEALPERERERRVWFVGGERSTLDLGEAGASETSALIAVYEPDEPDGADALISRSGVTRLHHEAERGPLWWVWGSGRRGEVWASGEGGRILRLDAARDVWVQEPVMMAPELLEKLVIWGVWGMRDAQGQLRVWAVGGSVRRGGPKGVLLSRSADGAWVRVIHPELPREDSEDPLVGANLYKLWGRGDKLWIVGEGSLTLTARVSSDLSTLGELSDWRSASRVDVTGSEDTQSEDELRPQLLFTVSGVREPNGPIWVVGGYDRAIAWRWDEEANTVDARGWRALELPITPALNGVHASSDLTLGVGQRGAVVAWPSQAPLGASELITQRRVRGAEYMTLHSAWRDRGGGYWVVGGDLVTLSEGVILSPAELPSSSVTTTAAIDINDNVSVRRESW